MKEACDFFLIKSISYTKHYSILTARLRWRGLEKAYLLLMLLFFFLENSFDFRKKILLHFWTFHKNFPVRFEKYFGQKNFLSNF